MDDRHAPHFAALERAILGGTAAGTVSDSAYLHKVARHAYRVTDADVQRLKDAGRSDDEIFEATLRTAFEAARQRLELGLAAIDEACR